MIGYLKEDTRRMAMLNGFKRMNPRKTIDKQEFPLESYCVALQTKLFDKAFRKFVSLQRRQKGKNKDIKSLVRKSDMHELDAQMVYSKPLFQEAQQK